LLSICYICSYASTIAAMELSYITSTSARSEMTGL